MKTKVLLAIICILSFFVSSAQFDRAVTNHAAFSEATVLNLSLIDPELKKQKQYYTDEQWERLLQKKYLTNGYSPCYVDDYKTLGYLRYNMADDQMEFLKDDKTYYIRKEAGKTIRFTTLKSKYRVYEYDGRLDYFLVQKEGKSSLLVKQIVKYIKPKPAKTSYDEYKPANFLRVKDQYFIAFDNEKLVKTPRKKKDFLKVFRDKSSEIKNFMKKNKLGYKSLKDLEKIIAHYNTL